MESHSERRQYQQPSASGIPVMRRQKAVTGGREVRSMKNETEKRRLD